MRGVAKAIAELRESGWWQIDQGGGRGRTNSYAPIFERVNTGSGFEAGKDEQPFGVLAPKTLNRKVKNPERQFTRTSKYQEESDSTVSLSNEFETFWRAYPSRAPHPNPKKPAAEKFAAAMKRGVDPRDIIRGAENYRAAATAAGTDPRYIAQAATFLKQERWSDHQKAPEALRPRVGMN
jgi:hypothetical protein